MSNYTYLTQGGYDKVKSDLEELKTTGRMEAARAIAEARAPHTHEAHRQPNRMRNDQNKNRSLANCG